MEDLFTATESFGITKGFQSIEAMINIEVYNYIRLRISFTLKGLMF